MSIVISVVNHCCQRLEPPIIDNTGLIEKLQGIVGENSPCLRFIDAHDLTLFNETQIGMFTREWQGLREWARSAEERRLWKAILDMAMKYERANLEYLLFLGENASCIPIFSHFMRRE